MKKQRPTHSWRNLAIPGTTTPSPTTETARGLLDALGRRDFAAVRQHLHADVALRVLLPRHVMERTSAPEVQTAFRSWLEPAHDFEVVALVHDPVTDHEYVASRFLVRPDWAPDQWHVIEHVGFVHVRNDRISRIDLVSSGFHPVRLPTDDGFLARLKEGLR